MNAKMLTPKRGEIGLAKFHRGIGLFSFAAGVALMLVSFTALFWFGGVIGLPKIARVAVAIAFEVLAATLASSATTARRKTGETDGSAWLAFAAVVSVNAFANVMHVIVFLVHAKPGTPAADLPVELRTANWFIAAACVFAAICALGGTLGVHRFGWLRANGADAEWTDTEQGVVVEQQNKPRPAPAAKQKPAEAPAPDARPAEQTPAPARVEAPAARDAGDQGARDIEDTIRKIARQMITEDDSEKPDGAEVRRRAGLARNDKPVAQTTRGWVRDEYDKYLDARGTDEARAETRAEVHLADPEPDDEIEVDTRPRHVATNVA